MLLCSLAFAQATPPSVAPQTIPPATATLGLSAADVDKVVRAQDINYLRVVVVQKCAGKCGPTNAITFVPSPPVTKIPPTTGK